MTLRQSRREWKMRAFLSLDHLLLQTDSQTEVRIVHMVASSSIVKNYSNLPIILLNVILKGRGGV